MNDIFHKIKYVDKKSIDNCVICLNKMTKLDKLWDCNQCHKIMHEDCIKRWMSFKKDCPNCRYKININTEEIVYNDNIITADNYIHYYNMHMYHRMVSMVFFGVLAFIIVIFFIIFLLL